MEEYLGKIVTIFTVGTDRAYEIEEDNQSCAWTDEMFEKVTETVWENSRKSMPIHR